MTPIQIFCLSLGAAISLIVLCFMLRPATNKTFYKKGTPLLILLFAANFAQAQLIVSEKQICLNGNDKVIDETLKIAITGDSVFIYRPNQARHSYPMRKVRRKKYGFNVRFGHKAANSLKVYVDRQGFPDTAFLNIGEMWYFLAIKPQIGL